MDYPPTRSPPPPPPSIFGNEPKSNDSKQKCARSLLNLAKRRRSVRAHRQGALGATLYRGHPLFLLSRSESEHCVSQGENCQRAPIPGDPQTRNATNLERVYCLMLARFAGSSLGFIRPSAAERTCSQSASQSARQSVSEDVSPGRRANGDLGVY